MKNLGALSDVFTEIKQVRSLDHIETIANISRAMLTDSTEDGLETLMMIAVNAITAAAYLSDKAPSSLFQTLGEISAEAEQRNLWAGKRNELDEDLKKLWTAFSDGEDYGSDSDGSDPYKYPGIARAMGRGR